MIELSFRETSVGQVMTEVKLACGEGFTLSVLVIVSEHPAAVATISVMVCTPAVVNVKFGFCTVDVFAPAVQFHETILPFEFVDWSVKVTGEFTHAKPLANNAFGFELMLINRESEIGLQKAFPDEVMKMVTLPLAVSAEPGM